MMPDDYSSQSNSDTDNSPVADVLPADEASLIAQANDMIIQAQALLEQERYEEALDLIGAWQPVGLTSQFWMRYHYVKGWALLNLTQLDQSYVELTNARQLAEQLEDRRYLGYISYRLGVHHYRRNQFAAAERHLITSWHAVKDGVIREPKFSMYVNLSLGNAVLRQGRFRGAIGHYNDALTDIQYLRDSKWVATIYWGMGLAYMYMAEFSLAKLNMAKSLQIQQKVAANSFLAEATGMYGMILMRTNQIKAAEQELHHAIFLGKQVGNNSALLIAYANLAEAYLYEERFGEALSIAEQSVAEARELHATPLDLAQVLHTLGKVHSKRQEYEAALDAFAEAENLMLESGDQPKYANLLRDYGDALARLGKFQVALPKLELANYILNPELKRYALA